MLVSSPAAGVRAIARLAPRCPAADAAVAPRDKVSFLRGALECATITGGAAVVGRVVGGLADHGWIGTLVGGSVGVVMGWSVAWKHARQRNPPPGSVWSRSFTVRGRQVSIGLQPVALGPGGLAVGLVPIAHGQGARAIGVSPEVHGSQGTAIGLIRTEATGTGSRSWGLYLTEAQGERATARGAIAQIANGPAARAYGLIGSLASGERCRAFAVYFTMASGTSCSARGGVSVVGSGVSARAEGLALAHTLAPSTQKGETGGGTP